jgi:AraC family transcriptional regulator of adaptative response / DNA-3-methyladenine glycosylase II
MTPVQLDADRCRSICRSGDPRYDGWFIVGVTSTGIYCRPSCPARTPRAENMVFLPSAAAAQAAGFRACKRCRPDASPGSPEWNLRGDVVARAMRLIADGEVDRVGVEGLARRLGYSPRHLHRILVAEVGAGPLAIARAQRAQTARLLIETTSLPFATVAFAAGFSSIRQFNDTVREVFALSPTELRSRRRSASRPEPGVLSLRLPVRLPFDGGGVWSFLALRAVPGLEEVDGDVYRRTLSLPHGAGAVSLRHRPGAAHVEATLRLDDVADLAAAVQRCRRLLDLDADPVAIDEVLGELGPAGGRVPGAVDGWEVAARAVTGQQVSLVAGLRTLGRLVERFGAGGLPAPDVVAGLDPADLGMPRARGAALVALADAVASGRVELDVGADREETRRRLLAIPGIGPWTTDYVALRALADPDVFLPRDIGLRRGLAALGVDDPTGERWRPWRSYAVVRLWGLEAARAASRGGKGGDGTTTDRPVDHDRSEQDDRQEQEDGHDDRHDDRSGHDRRVEHRPHDVPVLDAEPPGRADAGRVGRRPARGGVARRPGRPRAARAAGRG